MYLEMCQVEFYFSDVNLATTEHLMRFITKDPEGFGEFGLILNKLPDKPVNNFFPYQFAYHMFGSQ
jgi:hypothetical protein